MSEIDKDSHKCIGFIRCDFDNEYFSIKYNKEPVIPIYKILEDEDFGKVGDLVVGNGSEGMPMLKLSTIKAIKFLTTNEFNVDDAYSMIETDWSPTTAYLLGDGFKKIGWNYKEVNVEFWIATHIVSFLKREYYDDYKEFIGNVPLDYDGSICRLTG